MTVVHAKAYVDLNLPAVVTRSLANVVNTYKQLSEDDGGNADELGPHTRFALTGRFWDEGRTEHRVQVQAVQGDISELQLEQTADVDSALGFLYEDEDFPVFEGSSFFWQVLNNPSYTLKSDLHLPKYALKGTDGQGDLKVRGSSPMRLT